MAESPLSKLGRLAGGIVLMQGRLGHQMLGQMLILGSSEVEVAGASVALSATTGQQDPVLQATLRTAVPAVAVHLLSNRREKRLRRLETYLAEKERELAAQDQAFLQQEASLQTRQVELATLDQTVLTKQASLQTREEELATLDREFLKKEAILKAHQTELATRESKMLAEQERLGQVEAQATLLQKENGDLQSTATELRKKVAELEQLLLKTTEAQRKAEAELTEALTTSSTRRGGR